MGTSSGAPATVESNRDLYERVQAAYVPLSAAVDAANAQLSEVQIAVNKELVAIQQQWLEWYRKFDRQLAATPGSPHPARCARRRAVVAAAGDPPQRRAVLPRKLAGATDVDVLRRLRDKRIPVLLYGPPGTGKTAMVEAAFPDLLTVTGTGDTVVEDFLGTFIPLPDGGYEFVYGPLVTAMREAGPPQLGRSRERQAVTGRRTRPSAPIPRAADCVAGAPIQPGPYSAAGERCRDGARRRAGRRA